MIINSSVQVHGISSEVVRTYSYNGEEKQYRYKEMTLNTKPNSNHPYYITVEVNDRMYRELEGIEPGDEVMITLNIGSQKLNKDKTGKVDILRAYNNLKLSSIAKLGG